jgi:hypothetical protein
MSFNRTTLKDIAVLCALIAVPACGDDSAGNDAPEDADSGTGQGTSNGALFTGEPECGSFGFELKGTIAGESLEEKRQGSSELLGTSFRTLDRSGDEVVSNLSFITDVNIQQGTVSTIKEGRLTFSSMPSVGPYCIVQGKVGFPKSQPMTGARFQYTVTAVKRLIGGVCEGQELPANLKGCVYRTTK